MTEKSEGKPAQSLPAGSYDFAKLRDGAKPEDARADKAQKVAGSMRADQKLNDDGVRVHDPDSKAAKANAAPEQKVEQTIDELKGQLANITDKAELSDMRKAEKAGDNRSGALDAIDARIAELETTSARKGGSTKGE